MGFFDDALDFVEDTAGAAVETVGETAVAVAETAAETVDVAYQAAATVVDAGVTIGSDIGAVAADTVITTGADVGAGLLDIGDWALTGADDYLFDPVNYISQGAVDLNYDGGNFSGTVDFGDNGLGVSLGTDGFGASGSIDVGVVKGTFSYTDGDFTGSASAGIDWGPLPYAEGHVTIKDDGTIDIGGRAQGIIPTPIGVVVGDVRGGYHQLPDGSWGAYGGADGTLITTGGMTVSAGGQFSYGEEADGDVVWQAGGHVGVGIVGGPSVEVGGEYHHIEDDGRVTEGGSVYAQVEAYGVTARANAGYDHIQEADGTTHDVYGAGVEASAYGVEAGARGQYAHTEGADGSVTDSFAGELHASAGGVGGHVGGSHTETVDADGTTSSTNEAWADVDGLDAASIVDTARGVLGDETGGVLDDLPIDIAPDDALQQLVGNDDFDDVLSTVASGSGLDVADVGRSLAETAGLDDFGSDLLDSEVVEAAADDAWDDLGQ